MKNWIFTTMLGLVLGVVGAFGEEVVRSAAALRALSPEEAQRYLPVEMDVVATFVDRSTGLLFVNEGGDGFYLSARELVMEASWLVVGRRLRVKGRTAKGEFLPMVLNASFEDLGGGELPVPLVQNSMDQFLKPALDAQWVEVVGVVKKMGYENGRITLSLKMGDYRLPIEFPKNEHFGVRPGLPSHLLERKVRVRGVAVTQFNSQRQMCGRMLFLPGFEFLTEIEPMGESRSLPLRRVDELLLADSPVDEKVRVRGVVTHAIPERMVFMRGGGGSIKVESALARAFKRGTVLEAEGVVTVGPFRPGLNAVKFTEVGVEQAPKPVAMDGNAVRRSSEQFEFVSVDAMFVDVIENLNQSRLLCRDGDVRFEVVGPLKLLREVKLEPGMRLRLNGICELEVDNPFGITRSTKLFNLRLRDVEDLEVLERPPYLNYARLLKLLAAAVIAGSLFAVWVLMLRRKVVEQSKIIGSQLTVRATLDERQRIARELHDTLEQELSGVSMLLDTAGQQAVVDEVQSRRALTLAQQLLRHSRRESRAIIRDLRSLAIENMGLVGAMNETLRPLVVGRQMAFECWHEGEIVALPGTVETAFLRIAHEAVANAAQHSMGSVVRVRMSYGDDEVRLEVSDDGKGFVPMAGGDGTSGHFGLIGMRERALRMGARLEVESVEKQGTKVSLCWGYSKQRLSSAQVENL